MRQRENPIATLATRPSASDVLALEAPWALVAAAEGIALSLLSSVTSPGAAPILYLPEIVLLGLLAAAVGIYSMAQRIARIESRLPLDELVGTRLPPGDILEGFLTRLHERAGRLIGLHAIISVVIMMMLAPSLWMLLGPTLGALLALLAFRSWLCWEAFRYGAMLLLSARLTVSSGGRPAAASLATLARVYAGHAAILGILILPAVAVLKLAEHLGLAWAIGPVVGGAILLTGIIAILGLLPLYFRRRTRSMLVDLEDNADQWLADEAPATPPPREGFPAFLHALLTGELFRDARSDRFLR